MSSNSEIEDISILECSAINDLIRSTSHLRSHSLKWIPHSEITNIETVQIESDKTVRYAMHKRHGDVMLLLLGSHEKCTPESVDEFARIHSLPTHEHANLPNVNHFKRYSKWFSYRNRMICGFTKYEDNYYMMAKRRFHHYYSLCGFCSACGILRCSSVWCICGHKELSDGWSSNNKKLDKFIKNSQAQTVSANEAYMEWIPFDRIKVQRYSAYLTDLPAHCTIRLIPLEITEETEDSYYDKLCKDHPDICTTNVWITIGFTYNAKEQKYYLIKFTNEIGLCLACTERFTDKINAFCWNCKAPRPLDWTTGNDSLDSLIMQSWNNTKDEADSYIQWIEYSQLRDVQKTTLLYHGCTHVADWLEPRTNKVITVMMKKISDGQNARSFDFYQLTKDYPEIITPDNIWIVGITQAISTGDYFLVFYRDVLEIVERYVFMHHGKNVKLIPYTDFNEIKEIGSGGYGTVYTAWCESLEERIVIKRFKNFESMPEVFISEFNNHAKCSGKYPAFLKIYGITQQPGIKDCMIVMQYASGGNLLSFLEQNFNVLTWKMKLHILLAILNNLYTIHDRGLVHCDLHGGNIVLNCNADEIEGHIRSEIPFVLICDFGLSRSKNSSGSKSAVKGVLPFIAPEVLHDYKFTQQSDIYAIGIIMHLIASGEHPFRNRPFDEHLATAICNGLRPAIPAATPKAYADLARKLCDADPNKRPTAFETYRDIFRLIEEADKDTSDDNIWNAVYRKDVEPLSRIEKESKYSSKVVPGESNRLPKPKNDDDDYSGAA